MTHPLLEGTRSLARRFREERRARASLTAEQFLDAEPASASYPAGIAREQWIELLDVLRNAPEKEVDPLIAEWLEQQAAAVTAANPPTMRAAEQDPAATLPGPPPAEDAQFIDRRYRIVRVLGEGAFGKVFLVEDKLQNDQQLALKLIKKEHTATSEALMRFKNEILLLRVLSHPGIPQIFNDGISEDGEFYYTMAYVSGRTLDDVIRKEAPLEPLRIVRITKQVLDVLEYAHARGAIHRDLKPGNIFLVNAGTPKEQVRVLDFGIARILSREGILEHAQTMHTENPLGTPHYMSPEQVRGTEVDGRTDLYALGVILYQMCSGRFPFSGKTLMEILAARLERPPNSLEDTTTPMWLRELVMKLLEREREHRPDTTAIRLMLDQLHGTQRELSRKLTWIGAAVVVIAGGLGWALFGGGKKPDGEQRTGGTDTETRANPGDDKSKQATPGGKEGTPPAPEQPEILANAKPPNAPDERVGAIPAPKDSDGDGVPDTEDGCPNDPKKTEKGQCGCGQPDTDSDGDGTADCIDKCPNDANKQAPGLCGCGHPDVDSDGDGHLDCDDYFPEDPTRWQSEAGSSSPTPAPVQPTVRLPRGCVAAPDATLDGERRPSALVHEQTKIRLELVEAGAASFYLGHFEVTRDEWARGPETLVSKVKLAPPPPGEKSGQHPVASITLEEAKDFCSRLDLRLPTTAEWDRAAALGGGMVFPWGDEFVAGACNSNGPNDGYPQSAPVGSFPNDHCGPFFDMAGNVQEYCEADGRPALRGGGWNSAPDACKLGRPGTPPPRGSGSIGFRVALTPPP